MDGRSSSRATACTGCRRERTSGSTPIPTRRSGGNATSGRTTIPISCGRPGNRDRSLWNVAAAPCSNPSMPIWGWPTCGKPASTWSAISGRCTWAPVWFGAPNAGRGCVSCRIARSRCSRSRRCFAIRVQRRQRSIRAATDQVSRCSTSPTSRLRRRNQSFETCRARTATTRRGRSPRRAGSRAAGRSRRTLRIRGTGTTHPAISARPCAPMNTPSRPTIWSTRTRTAVMCFARG